MCFNCNNIIPITLYLHSIDYNYTNTSELVETILLQLNGSNTYYETGDNDDIYIYIHIYLFIYRYIHMYIYV